MSDREIWRAGDLAQCISLLGFPAERASGLQLFNVYTVTGVIHGRDSFGAAQTGLRFREIAMPEPWWFNARGFRKLRPLRPGKEDFETVAAMTEGRITVSPWVIR